MNDSNIVSELTKKYGKETIQTGVGNKGTIESISTGSLGLDKASGIGGYPKGRIIEIFGPEHSGKTTLAIHAMAEAQKQGGKVAFLDVEHTLDFRYAESIGVDVDSLVIVYPETGEQTFDIADAFIKSGEFALIVLDSVAAVVPKAELEGEMGDQQMGLQARLIGKGIRRIVDSLHKTQTTFIAINQMRQKIGVMFGNPETRPGGKSLDYFSSMMLDIRKRAPIKGDNDEILGNLTEVKFTKNKVGGMPQVSVEFNLLWGKGIDYLSEVLDAAIEAKVIEKSGAWFSYKGKQIGQGRDNTLAYLKDNGSVLSDIEEVVNPGRI